MGIIALVVKINVLIMRYSDSLVLGTIETGYIEMNLKKFRKVKES